MRKPERGERRDSAGREAGMEKGRADAQKSQINHCTEELSLIWRRAVVSYGIILPITFSEDFLVISVSLISALNFFCVWMQESRVVVGKEQTLSRAHPHLHFKQFFSILKVLQINEQKQ